MSTEAFQPGQIWPGGRLDADALMAQWTIEFRHRTTPFDLSGIAFTEADWQALEWNAREALHLNAHREGQPLWWRHITLPQDAVNLHLIRAYDRVLAAWQQFIHLPHIRVINALPPPAECAFRMTQARGRLEAAQRRYESLVADTKALQQFSLRQFRIYQQLAALLADLEPLVEVLAAHAATAGGKPSVTKVSTDLLWHGREVLRLAGRTGNRPSQKERFLAPRLRINQLMGGAALQQAAFLKGLMNIS